MPLPTTIDGVLAALDEIIERAAAENDPRAYFAFVYRRITAEIKRAIAAGEFADNARMERFDVAFANLYLAAEAAYQTGAPCSNCWKLSFRAAETGKHTVLQHILLGMNAHINLDLGVAAGRIMQGEDLNELAADFRKVNDNLASLIDELQAGSARHSFLLRWLDRFAKRRDEAALDFGMRAAREQAWVVAQAVWTAGPEQEAVVIHRVDQNVTALGERFLRPRSRLLRWLLRQAVRWQAPSSVAVGIERLRG